MNKFKEKIENLKEKTENIIDMINNVIENMEKYYEINYSIFNNYKIQNKNYEHLKNISEIKNNININEINDIINKVKGNDIIIQITYILNIYIKLRLIKNTITRNPPKECLLYENIVNLNNEFNKLEREIKEKSNNLYI